MSVDVDDSRSDNEIRRVDDSVGRPLYFADGDNHAVTNPDMESGQELLRILDGWLGGQMSPDETLSTFIRDNELAWLRGSIPAEFW